MAKKPFKLLALLVASFCVIFWVVPNLHLAILTLFRQKVGVAVPFDDAWQPENYRAGKGSELGALGVPSCQPIKAWLLIGARLLRLNLDFNPDDLDRKQGECWWDLEALGKGRVLDLAGGEVEAKLSVPFWLTVWSDTLRGAGGQLILESESTDGHRARFYANYQDFTNWLFSEPLALKATVDSPGYAAWKDPDWDPFRVTRIGVKISLNSSVRLAYRGSVIVTDLRVHEADPEEHRREQDRMRTERRPPPDEDTLRMLSPLESAKSGSQALPGDLVPTSASVRSIDIIPEPGNPNHRVWRAQIHFPSYQPDSAGRSARLGYQFKQFVDLRGRRLSASAAIGPALRSFAPRPNRIQFELFDDHGRVLRGPAEDISSAGITFDANAREIKSNWIPFAVAPRTGAPLAMGFVEEAFDPSRISQIGVRFLIGKFSDEFRLDPYPLTGTLLLSEVRVEVDTHAVDSIPRLTAGAPVEKPPVPIDRFMIGVNYPWIRFGYDLGLYPFGGRDTCGFSTNRQKLMRDFTKLAANGIRLVRIWMLGDLRSGVRIDQSGFPLGLDRCVASDVAGLVEAASVSGIQLLPVITDFLIADGTAPDREFGGRRWREGEFPQFLTDAAARKLFLDKVVRPLVHELAVANRKYGQEHAILAVDAVNELENAVAIFSEGKFSEAKIFVQEILRIIHSEGLKTTLGSRNRNDLVKYWADLEGMDYWQAHYYSAFGEEERQPLHLPAGNLGLKGPIIIGELEPSDIEKSIETVWTDGYDGVVLWSAQDQPLDGFRVDLSAIKRWLDSKKNSLERGVTPTR